MRLWNKMFFQKFWYWIEIFTACQILKKETFGTYLYLNQVFQHSCGFVLNFYIVSGFGTIFLAVCQVLIHLSKEGTFR